MLIKPSANGSLPAYVDFSKKELLAGMLTWIFQFA